MNIKLQHFLLTKIMPTTISGIVMLLVFNGIGLPYIEGADGNYAKMTDEEFCRVGAFVTDEYATAQERSTWCNEAQFKTNDMAIFGFIGFSVIGMIVMTKMFKPVEEWNEEIKTRSAV